MNISKMLKKESNAIKDNKDVGSRIDCTDLLISTVFSDNHIHHIIPSQEITDKIVFDLLSYMKLKKNVINDIIVKISTIYIKNHNKENDSFDEMIDLIEEIKNKLVESKEINNQKKLKIEEENGDIV